jgi:hypothetical protein
MQILLAAVLFALKFAKSVFEVFLKNISKLLRLLLGKNSSPAKFHEYEPQMQTKLPSPLIFALIKPNDWYLCHTQKRPKIFPPTLNQTSGACIIVDSIAGSPTDTVLWPALVLHCR